MGGPIFLFSSEVTMKSGFEAAIMQVCILLVLIGCSSCTINTTNHYSPPNETLTEWAGSPLSHSGKVFLNGNIEKSMATIICQKLFILDMDEKVDRITLYINSGGGEDYAYMAVDTVNQGYCMSAAVGVHQAATGKRFAYKNSLFLLHAFKSRSSNSDSERLVKMVNQNFTEIIRGRSELPADWFPLSGTNRICTADEALGYKLVDEIIPYAQVDKSLRGKN